MKQKELLKEIRKEIRCANCNKLILKGKFWGDYSLEFICPRCKNLIEVSKIKKEKQNG